MKEADKTTLGPHGLVAPSPLGVSCFLCHMTSPWLGHSITKAHHTLKLMGWARKSFTDPLGQKGRRWICRSCKMSNGPALS